MTLAAQPEAVTAPEWQFFDATVAGVRRLGPSFVRITFTGPGLAGFGLAGDDQRFKLVLPRDPAGMRRLVDRGSAWYPEYCAMPEELRPDIRTYTVRAARPELAEIDVDLVLHGVADGHAGPAARWAAAAVPGDRVVLLGPDRPGRGRMWGVEWAPPAAARTLLLAGDETAVPAVCAIVEALPAAARTVTALLEVPEAGDVVDLALPPGTTVRWLPREGAARGSLLVPAVHAALCELGIATPSVARAGADYVDLDLDREPLWEVPDADAAAGFYAWLAGEAAVVKQLRRRLVGDLGVPRGAVAFMGYWRDGVAG
ncbi:siderophore-interacting protein [Geodermatophilus sp. CPCC 206100]|uniref:siderophore-interacting protein n=1 Tax=Geodermatophilus sp. CPCC 206100 TaxID=3020054 RepID=UPI003AFF9B56